VAPVFFYAVISKPYRHHIFASPRLNVFVSPARVLPLEYVIFITQIPLLIQIHRIYVAQITAAARLSTSKWKTTRYKPFPCNVSFIPEPLTG
jgi:hypothetical protein